MTAFRIDVVASQNSAIDDPRPLAIRLNEHSLTQLLRPGVDVPDDYLNVPPAQLAFWFVDNWWRLRWECLPVYPRNTAWQLRHELSSLGGGYAWPRLRIWGDGERVGISTRGDPQGVVGPVRFLSNSLAFMEGREFETGIDNFLATAVDEMAGYGSDRAALRAQFAALLAERSDPEMSMWRKLEAQSGFDPDVAPDDLMRELAEQVQHYGERCVEEAVQAAPGIEAAQILRSQIGIARSEGIACDFTAAMSAAGNLRPAEYMPAWDAAEEVAPAIRAALGVTSGPVSNSSLLDFLGVSRNGLEITSGQNGTGSKLSHYGLRLRDSSASSDRVALRSRWPASRRFELVRALGDAIWSGDDLVGPLARSKTARQKFQRAFAQSVLCPFEELIAYIGTSDPSNDDVQAAARHFDVSERLVQSTLVNKHAIDRERYEELIDEAA
jgi:hypothetical protein